MQKYFIYIGFTYGLLSCNLFSKNDEAAFTTLLVDSQSNESDSANRLENQVLAPDTLELRLISLGLIDVQSINPHIIVDLKYSTEDNFMKTNVYGSLNRAYLQQKPAEMLGKAQELLSARDSNLYLLVYDAVRPVWVQWKMWNLLDSIPVSKRVNFVSNPKNKSLHNYGAAVDLTICDAAGKPLDMGAGFDDPRPIAYPTKEAHFLSTGLLTQEQVNNRRLLREVMKKAGFRNLDTEWWHFNAMSRDEAKKMYQPVP
jgi:D-alanyl-D-alanine dipeptidase